MVFPKRAATLAAICRPTVVDPVNEIKGIRLSLTMASATSCASGITKPKISTQSLSFSTLLQRFCTATAHNGVLAEGFQIVTLPQIAAINAFQAHTELEN